MSKIGQRIQPCQPNIPRDTEYGLRIREMVSFSYYTPIYLKSTDTYTYTYTHTHTYTHAQTHLNYHTSIHLIVKLCKEYTGRSQLVKRTRASVNLVHIPSCRICRQFFEIFPVPVSAIDFNILCSALCFIRFTSRLLASSHLIRLGGKPSKILYCRYDTILSTRTRFLLDENLGISKSLLISDRSIFDDHFTLRRCPSSPLYIDHIICPVASPH